MLSRSQSTPRSSPGKDNLCSLVLHCYGLRRAFECRGRLYSAGLQFEKVATGCRSRTRLQAKQRGHISAQEKSIRKQLPSFCSCLSCYRDFLSSNESSLFQALLNPSWTTKFRKSKLNCTVPQVLQAKSQSPLVLCQVLEQYSELRSWNWWKKPGSIWSGNSRKCKNRATWRTVRLLDFSWWLPQRYI